MIPFATPRDGELINLSQIVKVRTHKPGNCLECRDANPGDKTSVIHIVGEQSACTVYFSDGRSEIFAGDESKFLNIELHFALNAYRTFQQQVTSQIVAPDGQRSQLYHRSTVAGTAAAERTRQ